MNAITDSQLVTLQNQLRAVLFKYSSDSELIQDAIQEALLWVHTNIERYDSTRGTLLTWAAPRARHALYRINQKQGPVYEFLADLDRSEVVDYPEPQSPSALEQACYSVPYDERIDLTAAVSELRPFERTLIEAHYLRGLTNEEIGCTLFDPPVSRQAVDYHIRRIRATLREALKAYDNSQATS